ncbi:hypothetical protein [Rickettsiella massiliensis]|uniref:hypothetical protein n=1 Tax=Rickettsiella massiliensis TaxID=676517 RepID=UPI00029A05E1|nr:hypothetical protein [Rickettsiella massiliensis]
MKLSEFVADGIEEVSKELSGILPAEIVAMLTKNSTCESLFNKINSILEKETQTKNTPISKITGNPHATFQLQTHSDRSIAPPASNLNHFSLN